MEINKVKSAFEFLQEKQLTFNQLNQLTLLQSVKGMQTSDQQQRIINHLKLLREQSLSEYLGTNLQSLANKQVIEDILKQFISVHQQQFLTTITNTIMQVKQQYRAIKKQLKQKQEQQSLMKIKTQNEISQRYEKQMQVFFEKWLKLQQLAQQKSGQRNPMKAINKLFESIQHLMKSIQDEKVARARVIEQCQQQKKRTQSVLVEKQLLQAQIVKLNQTNREKELLNKSLQQQIYQKHMKVDEITVEYKLLEKELSELESANMSGRQMIEYMESNAAKMREQTVKFKQDIQIIFKQKQTLQDDNNALRRQVDQLRKQIDGLTKHIDDLGKQGQTLKKEIVNLLKQIDELNHQITDLENKIQEKEETGRVVGGRIQQLNKKCLDVLQENGLLKQNIFNFQKQITTITTSHEQQRVGYQQAIRQKQQQHEKHQKKLQQAMLEYRQQLQALQFKLTQQKKLSQQHSQQLSHQHSQKLSLTLQQKDKQLKQYIDQKDRKINQIEQQLKELKCQMREREYYQRQYELYLQEIVQLKEKIRLLQPTRYQQQMIMDVTGRPRGFRNKRSKIYFLLTQVHVKLETLRQQNISIGKQVKQYMMNITSYCNKSIQIITARVLQTKLSCDYCDHHNRNYISTTTKIYNNNNHHSHIQQQQRPKLMKSNVMGNGNGNNNRDKYSQPFGHTGYGLSFGVGDNQRLYQNQKQLYQNNHQYQNSYSQHQYQSSHPQHQYQSSHPQHQYQNIYPQKVLSNAQRFSSTLPRSNITNVIDSNNSSSMLRNVKKMSQKMKHINQQNSSYQLHLTRILSQKSIHNPYQ